ncbi:GerW family sporulation protein [Longirhabdus pacifica]|uniref:GerW family sporulation protein n=1 Tax=Longirhabdus pacifica TaxID=2305227 RepID=UPI001008E573|nr:GerW family sporulation protein [Longirhabdus pacifica]
MTDHPIGDLMETALANIKEMVDVNTIVGNPVQTPDGSSVIMPISKVGFGFVAGGSDYQMNGEQQQAESEEQPALPFGGGSGGGVSITPIAFLVVGKEGVQVVPLDNQTHLMDRIIDSAPRMVDKLQEVFSKGDKQDHSTGVM